MYEYNPSAENPDPMISLHIKIVVKKITKTYLCYKGLHTVDIGLAVKHK